MAKDAGWTTIPLQPLIGMLDTRSRPAELSPGSFRFKLNFAVNRTSQLERRSGHGALNFGERSDDGAVANWDFHRRGHDREPVTMQLESIANDGTRRLIAGTQSTLAWMNNDTSEWTEIASGLGDDGTRFRGAVLNGKAYFTNNNDAPLSHELGSSTTAAIPGLTSTKARIVMSFSGVIVWMNVLETDPQPTRIRWSNYQDGTSYTTGGADEVSGFQDLDYGDEILAAIELFNSVYIFTLRSIWRMSVSPSGDTIFAFQRIYTDPEGKNGCLAYPNTLISDGKALYWWSRDSVWRYDPYTPAPETPEWLMKGSGHIFSTTHPDRLETRCCESPVGRYRAETKELWFSYPLASTLEIPTCLNNRSLVFHVEHKTGDVVDYGYSSFCNFSRSAESAQACNASQVFIGASASDYCLKSIGGVNYREEAALTNDDPELDISDDDYATSQVGYYSRLVGKCPLGYPQRDKILNNVQIEHETEADSELASPNLLTLRIGNSEHNVDPMSLDAYCSPQWHEQESIALICPDTTSMTSLETDGLRPSDPTDWVIYEIGKHLYFDIRVTSASGAAPTGSNSAWSSISFTTKVAA